ncbi:MAG: 23S rRNA (guanosine(2251)-2'-O)-methyltransferase RlmB [Desulfobacterales bacterium]
MSSRNFPKTEILAGSHPVAEAMRAGRRTIREIYVSRDQPAKRIEKVTNQARRLDIPLTVVTREEIRKLSDTPHHQDIAARTSPCPLMDFGALLKEHGRYSEDAFLLIIDSIEDPQNLGGLVRTAVCTGVAGILIPRDRSAAPTPAVSRASAGALEHARLCMITNLANCMKDLKKNHFWIIGLDQQGGDALYDIDMTGPRALVIGGEDRGIRPLVKRHCDFLCHIPQTGVINSLNASVAGGIAMYEALRQRMQKKRNHEKESASNEQS